MFRGVNTVETAVTFKIPIEYVRPQTPIKPQSGVGRAIFQQLDCDIDGAIPVIGIIGANTRIDDTPRIGIRKIIRVTVCPKVATKDVRTYSPRRIGTRMIFY